jgi:hypothetical protein
VRWLSVLVASLALLAAGCGGGSNESAATTETTTTAAETTTTDETTTETTTSEGDTTTDLSSILGNEDCLALVGVGAQMAQAFSGTNGLSSDDSAKLDELASKVPDEIKPDVETIAKAFATYAAKLKAIGIKTGSTPTVDQLQQLQAALTSLDQQELTTASDHIDAWAKANCKS